MAAKLCVFVVVVLGFAGLASGDIPHLLNYQGRLTDDTGKPVNDVKEMTFGFCDAAAGGSMLFAETQNVAVTGGVFNVLIGSATVGGVPGSVFSGADVFLSVAVRDEELLPRQRVASVGYAFKAAVADGAFVADNATHAQQADWAANAELSINSSNADEALHADAAFYADGAGFADYAENAGHADIADYANDAGNADSAGYADEAGYADNAGQADASGYAYNADLLDNHDSAEFAMQADMTAAISVHAASSAHDTRYYTETESDARFALKGETGFELPYNGSVEITDYPAFSVTNTTGTMAIRGLATKTGAGVTYGGYFESYADSGRAVTGVTNGAEAKGVHGESLGVSGIGVYGKGATGIYGESSSGFGVYGKGATGVVGESTTGWAVRGTTSSTSEWSPAVYGDNTGAGDGTYGRSANRHGAVGVSLSSNANHAGVWALNSGAGCGILAEAGSGGWAAILKGNLQIRSKATGLVVVELGEGLDYAEGFDVTDAERIEPGCVVVIDAQNPGKLALSSEAYDRKVAGIVAGSNGLGSGVKLGSGEFDHDVALAGRVYCNVDATDEAVQLGDLLTTSSTPGYAMAVKDFERAPGAVLGKAMQALPKGQKGRILVLVALQ